MIIAFCGYAGSGKDTAADILVKDYGFVKVAFADALREMAWDINPIVGWNCDNDNPVYYRDAIDHFGYHTAKAVFPEIRRFLQRLGTDGCRHHIDDSIWISLLLKRIEYGVALGQRFVISDLRFPNEASAVRSWSGREWKGVVVRLQRGSISSDHPSEVEVDSVEWDIEIDNNGTLEELRDTIHFFMGRLLL